jgi:hypothetical protein
MQLIFFLCGNSYVSSIVSPWLAYRWFQSKQKVSVVPVSQTCFTHCCSSKILCQLLNLENLQGIERSPEKRVKENKRVLSCPLLTQSDKSRLCCLKYFPVCSEGSSMESMKGITVFYCHTLLCCLLNDIHLK